MNLLLQYDIKNILGAAKGIICGFYLGTGLGNAIAINGEVYKGHTGSACELGHIPVPHLEEVCNCGKRGCMEFYASGNALKKAADKLNKDIASIFTYYQDNEELKNIIYHYAVSIATETAILDPAAIILGGGIVHMNAFPTARTGKSYPHQPAKP